MAAVFRQEENILCIESIFMTIQSIEKTFIFNFTIYIFFNLSRYQHCNNYICFSSFRQLWTVIDKRDEMLYLNAVKCVAQLMITECESTGVIKSEDNVNEFEGFRKSREELLIGILKCLGFFTIHTTPHCAEQVYFYCNYLFSNLSIYNLI